MAKISIVIPCFNAEKYIEECLQSIFCQDQFKDIEIIVINDNSTDSSLNILNKYSSCGKIILINNKKNIGQFESRNIGIRIASGNYISFVDADDVLSNNYLSCLFDKIKKFDNPDLILFSRSNFSKTKNKIIEKKYINENLKDDWFLGSEELNQIRSIFLTTDNYNSLCLKLVKRDLLLADNHNYNIVNTKNAEDRIKSYSIFDKAKNVVVIGDCIYHYRMNQSGFTKKKRTTNDLLHYFNNSIYELDDYYAEKWTLQNCKSSIYTKSVLIIKRALDIYLYRKIKIREIMRAFLSVEWDKIYPSNYLQYAVDNKYGGKSVVKSIIRKKFFSLFVYCLLKKVIYKIKHLLERH